MQSRPRKAAKGILGTELLRKVLQTKAHIFGIRGKRVCGFGMWTLGPIPKGKFSGMASGLTISMRASTPKAKGKNGGIGSSARVKIGCPSRIFSHKDGEWSEMVSLLYERQ